MLKIIISGCNGHMGQTVATLAHADPEVEIVAGFDAVADKRDTFPVYADPLEFGGTADAIIDFSSPAALSSLLNYCVSRQIPAVLCTTGYSEIQLAEIDAASAKVPLFRSGNMSLGINLLADLIKRAVEVLGSGYDIEIVERHHRRKVDAPSGTALMLADAARDAVSFDAEYVYDRSQVRKPRGDNEIGVSAVRGGTIVGEHEVIFAGLDEVIELKHTAHSRDVFATGAIRAAKYMQSIRRPGLYNMSDVLKD